MRRFVGSALRGMLRKFGLNVVKADVVTGQPDFPPDFDSATQDICRYVEPFTMTSPERVFALRHSVQYVIGCGVAGDIVECGVWKGGSMMAVARTLLELGIVDRRLLLFDTFEGMPEPTAEDVSFRGESASDLLRTSERESSRVWAYSSLQEVQDNLGRTGYPQDRIFLMRGRVEETIPANAPERIALLRLDTDWYESTYHELVHLYPRLSPGGVLIIDDYGHWAGARKAVDQYFSENHLPLLLNRIDYTGRICVKPS